MQKRIKYGRAQKIALRLSVILLFILAEAVLMWAVADSSITYSPFQREVLSGIKPPVQSKPVNTVKNEPPPPPLSFADMYLVIPRLFINAPIEAVGVTPNGEMATPQGLNTVAWYKEGPKPGEIGSAVLAAHYGGPYEIGVFRTINKLQAGDAIQLRDKHDKTLAYKVYKVATYNVADVPLQEVFNKSGDKYLNLVTCIGNWNAITSTYDQRLIVFAKQD